jgi:hypothetical protein
VENVSQICVTCRYELVYGHGLCRKRSTEAGMWGGMGGGHRSRWRRFGSEIGMFWRCMGMNLRTLPYVPITALGPLGCCRLHMRDEAESCGEVLSCRGG